MSDGTLLELFGLAAMVAVKLATPLLLAAVIVGLAVSLFQALTQINESTLSFIPKLMVMGLVLWLCLPWMSREMVEFTTRILRMIGEVTQ
ncbi:MAG: flagellar biosynthesis protein FliQ [Planctomycetes bacterium]|nr:flagellar biosynthesis protein FliQ [Planctomycetota bacterium]